MIYSDIRFLLLALMPATFAGTDYCDAKFCEKGKLHIACNNDEKFSFNCGFPKIVNITPAHRRKIIDIHNSLRSKIAIGFKQFPPATRMATMVWDDELAKLAELNVKQCEVRHDQCRNTHKFLFAGQNIAATRWRVTNLTESKVAENQILEWFNEYKVCPLDVIKRYKPSKGAAYGHFTAMVQDRSTHIGCAIIKSLSCGFEHQIMTCNYAYDNIFNAPVYSDGPTASQCTNGTNSEFNSLCSVEEKYN